MADAVDLASPIIELAAPTDPAANDEDLGKEYDSDSGDDVKTLPKKNSTSEKRRAQDRKFTAW